MPFGSRDKGANAERHIVELITPWWNRLEPSKFARTPGSGSWATSHDRAEFGVAGDLCTTAKRFPWGIEVKHREGWSDRELRAGRPSPVWGWWKQAQRDAAKMGLEPILLFRRNRYPWQAMIGEEFWAATCPLSRFAFSTPSFSWIANRLDSQRYGEMYPVVFPFEVILAMDPELFAKPPPRKKKVV